jgi:hypothetical protein
VDKSFCLRQSAIEGDHAGLRKDAEKTEHGEVRRHNVEQNSRLESGRLRQELAL